MLRAFGNRPDTAAIDEPFYAAYLAITGLDHPMRNEILASQSNDPQDVARELASRQVARADGATVQYEKHMTPHMVDGIDRPWFADASHVFLIRRPERVVASYAVKRADVTLEDLGYEQQAQLFDEVAAATGRPPPVVDTDDLLADPQAMLTALCETLELPWTPTMLTWPEGRWPCDGVWAAHWYGAVEQSTGFGKPSKPKELNDPQHHAIAAQATPAYERLATARLQP